MNNLERVFIALGSNLGVRAENLKNARAMLQRISLGGWKESRIYETSPLGEPRQANYLNQVVSFWYAKGAKSLLYYLKGTELLLGRKPRVHWDSREIDLDLLYYGQKIIAEKFSVPHKEIKNRQFVLEPLNDLDPDFIDPSSLLSVRQMLLALKAQEGTASFKIVSGKEL